MMQPSKLEKIPLLSLLALNGLGTMMTKPCMRVLSNPLLSDLSMQTLRLTLNIFRSSLTLKVQTRAEMHNESLTQV